MKNTHFYSHLRLDDVLNIAGRKEALQDALNSNFCVIKKFSSPVSKCERERAGVGGKWFLLCCWKTWQLIYIRKNLEKILAMPMYFYLIHSNKYLHKHFEYKEKFTSSAFFCA